MIEIATTATLPVAPRMLFATLADLDNWLQLDHLKLSCLTPAPLRVGSALRATMRVACHSIVSDCRVTEFDEGHGLVIRSTSGPVNFVVSGQVSTLAEAIPSASEISYRLAASGRGAFRLAEPAIAVVVRHYLEAQAEHVGELLGARRAEVVGGDLAVRMVS